MNTHQQFNTNIVGVNSLNQNIKLNVVSQLPSDQNKELQFQNNTSNSLFMVSIEVNDKKCEIPVFIYDTPLQIAYRYCQQNSWDLVCVEPISKKIKEQLEIQLYSQLKSNQNSVNIVLPKSIQTRPTQLDQIQFETPQKELCITEEFLSKTSQDKKSLSGCWSNKNAESLEKTQKKQAFMTTGNSNNSPAQEKFQSLQYQSQLYKTQQTGSGRQASNLNQSRDKPLLHPYFQSSHISINSMANKNKKVKPQKSYSPLKKETSISHCATTSINQQQTQLHQHQQQRYFSTNANKYQSRFTRSFTKNEQDSRFQSKNSIARYSSSPKSKSRSLSNGKQKLFKPKSIQEHAQFLKKFLERSLSQQDKKHLNNSYSQFRNSSSNFSTNNPKDTQLEIKTLQTDNSLGEGKYFMAQTVKSASCVSTAKNSTNLYKHIALERAQLFSNDTTFQNYQELPTKKQRKSLGDLNCTFHPHINQNSYKLAHRDPNMKTYEILYQNSKTIQTKKKLEKELFDTFEINNFSFKPHLNEVSLVIAKEKQKKINQNIANNIQDNDMIEPATQLLKDQDNTQINYENEILQNQNQVITNGQDPDLLNSQNFNHNQYDNMINNEDEEDRKRKEDQRQEQLEIQNAKIQEQIQHLNQQLNQNIKINNSKVEGETIIQNNNARSNSSYIGNDYNKQDKVKSDYQQSTQLHQSSANNNQQNYGNQSKQSSKQIQQQQQINKIEQMQILQKQQSQLLACLEQRTFSPNRISHQIVEKRKHKRFEEIFKVLDSDRDELISKDKIEVSKMREEIIILISPILLEIVDGNKVMSKDQFINRLETIFKNLDYVQKNQLMNVDFYLTTNFQSRSRKGSIISEIFNKIYNIKLNSMQRQTTYQENSALQLDEVNEAAHTVNTFTAQTSMNSTNKEFQTQNYNEKAKQLTKQMNDDIMRSKQNYKKFMTLYSNKKNFK